jgi:aldose 1-epimerase
MRKFRDFAIIAFTLTLIGASASMGKKLSKSSSARASNTSTKTAAKPAAKRVPQDQAVTIGGEAVVQLTRPRAANSAKPQFLGATFLPGEGMNMLSVKAYLPGMGEVELISGPPTLAEAKDLFEKQNDEFGNESFKIGAAFLYPYVNRIRGKLSADGKTIETTIAGKKMNLPANWHGKNPGAEVNAMHGLILNAKFEDVKSNNGAAESTISAMYHGGDFGGHWPSKSDVTIGAALKNYSLDLFVTAKNVGTDSLPVAITIHPYYHFPSGDRTQARLHVPGDQRALVTNYDDVFPTGKIVPVKDTPYDFTGDDGAALGSLFMDDCFTNLTRDKDGNATIEVIDPKAKYGLRIITLSKHIQSVQVYAPPDKDFVAVEPQFNLADPYNKKIWGDRDTGMVNVAPGRAVAWHIRLELFTPGK